MNNTPQWIKDYWNDNPATKCECQNKDCGGRLTKEHCFIYAGKQVQELWAIIDLCWNHHLGNFLVKEINQLISLRKATEEDLAKYPRKNWSQMRKYLEKKYGNANNT